MLARMKSRADGSLLHFLLGKAAGSLRFRPGKISRIHLVTLPSTEFFLFFVLSFTQLINEGRKIVEDKKKKNGWEVIANPAAAKGISLNATVVALSFW